MGSDLVANVDEASSTVFSRLLRFLTMFLISRKKQFGSNWPKAIRINRSVGKGGNETVEGSKEEGTPHSRRCSPTTATATAR